MINKRGQFFFVATLIIVTLILSFTNIYNSASSDPSPKDYEYLASEIKYEGQQIILNGYYNNLTQLEISQSLSEFTLLYSQIYPEYKITILSGEKPNLKVLTFLAGEKVSDKDVIENGNTVSLDLNSLKIDFTISQGYNFNVAIVKENEKGRFVSSA